MDKLDGNSSSHPPCTFPKTVFLPAEKGVFQKRSLLRKRKLLMLLVVLMAGVNIKALRSQSTAPQIWNNAGVNWTIDEHFAWRNSVAYNFLVSSEYPWDEFTITSTGAYRFKRFFNLFKYKPGLAYRINPSWGVDLGVIYQDSKNNVKAPAQSPTNLITNYVFEWGVVFSISSVK